MKYKVGDKVKIKPLEELKEVDITVDGMYKYANQIAIIKRIGFNDNYYNIDLDKGCFYWDDECFCERALPDLPKEFEILEKFEKEGWKAAPNKNYVDEKFERVVGIGPHGEEFTNTKTICNYIPASDIKTEPMFDILHERIDKLEKRIEELERKVDLVETLTMR